ncbi:dienelactone hydrolase family protein [Microvirga terricola]|uniref:Alpha/beta hydrolase n=1 Tax=Microvirga terricola TaxID=2719797 RepID=A0ABX0VBN7_9HYPH|nr:dienelactone hydrolase family protein [Microvirga terricola]NIX77267.1 alpha/beta hydrolase [Microvirga terricola]
MVHSVTELLVGKLGLPGAVTVPSDSIGLVVFAHGSGSSRLSPRNTMVARQLNEHRLATLLFDLLTDDEAMDRRNVFDIPLLGGRVVEALHWTITQPTLNALPVGLFGASTGAAAALVAAAEAPDLVSAVVSRGGRPDLAGPVLERVRAPTLLIVGGEDYQVLELNRIAQRHLRCETSLVVVPGATHLFEEPGTLGQVVAAASNWFTKHLAGKVHPVTSS